MEPFIEIPLTRGYVARISPEDEKLVAPYKWYAVTPKRSRTVYAYAYVPGGKGKRVMLHRLVSGFPKFQVDHRDLNGLNCVRGNMCVATGSQNCVNRPPSKTTSGYRGVCFHKASGKFEAGIKKDQRRIHLGLFSRAVDAAVAYNKAAIEIFGEFAILNQVSANG